MGLFSLFPTVGISKYKFCCFKDRLLFLLDTRPDEQMWIKSSDECVEIFYIRAKLNPILNWGYTYSIISIEFFSFVYYRSVIVVWKGTLVHFPQRLKYSQISRAVCLLHKFVHFFKWAGRTQYEALLERNCSSKSILMAEKYWENLDWDYFNWWIMI